MTYLGLAQSESSMFTAKTKSIIGNIFFIATLLLGFGGLQHASWGQITDLNNQESSRTVWNGELRSLHYQLTNVQYQPNLFNNYNQSNMLSPRVSWPGIAVTSTALAGIYTGIFSYEQDRRWGGPEAPFHFTRSLKTKGADKAGHFYATQAQASFISNLYKLSNVNPTTADLMGAGIALSIQTLVELKDGRIEDRGFGVYDEVANLLGAGWFYARQQSTFLQRFQMRWLYYPSSNSDLLPKGHRFTEDYTGHSYWLSMSVWDILPFYWPKFIAPTAGITLNGWVPNTNQQGYYSYHLSLNPDFNYIIPRNTALGRTFADLLNSFYFPAPALQVYPDFGFKLIFYGQK